MCKGEGGLETGRTKWENDQTKTTIHKDAFGDHIMTLSTRAAKSHPAPAMVQPSLFAKCDNDDDYTTASHIQPTRQTLDAAKTAVAGERDGGVMVPDYILYG